MESVAPNPLLDKAAEYIERLTDQVSRQQGEIERLELVVKEQGILMDSMTAQLKDNAATGPVDDHPLSDQQQKISDLETTIEVMTLDLESRSNSIAALFSQIVHLKAFIAKLLSACHTDPNSIQIIEDLRQLSAKANQLEASILETGIPLTECQESPEHNGIVSESAIHIPPKSESMQSCSSPSPERIRSESDELKYYKGRCAALEHQVTTLRAALLSQEEASRRISAATSTQHQASPIAGEGASPPSFRQLALVEMLHLVNREIHKSPKGHINNALDPELAPCLKAIASGVPATARQLQHFTDVFIRIMGGV